MLMSVFSQKYSKITKKYNEFKADTPTTAVAAVLVGGLIQTHSAEWG